jgi:phage host-nuclease inhibitor protein Gam
MGKTSKPETDDTTYVVPNKEQAVEAIAEIGRRQRERERIQTAMNDELAKVRQRYEEQADPHSVEIRRLSSAVKVWCDEHRIELTSDGASKSAHLASGDVHWRKTPAKVVIRNEDVVLATLRRLGLTQFIRVKEEVNRKALLDEPEAAKGIKGISVSQKEEFAIEPFETHLEEIA